MNLPAYDPQIHHRRSIRLKGYDYTQAGAYFITLVTYRREELFGRVVAGRMDLSALGQIARDEWLRSITMRQEIRLNIDEFIVMPNHMHGIVWIVPLENENDVSVGADGIRPNDAVRPGDEKGACTPRSGVRDHVPQHANSVGADGIRPNDVVRPVIYRPPKSLASFIAGYKASVTSRARRELYLEGIWQRNYYDHIIRSERQFMEIWEYIDANPQRWQHDSLNIL